MKRFLVFAAGEGESDRGGWGDFVGAYKTKWEAQDAVNEILLYDGWYEIVDLKSLCVTEGGPIR